MSAMRPCCSTTSDAIGLTELPQGTVARVISVGAGTSGAPEELSKRLAELGFLPGERVRVLGRGWFARERDSRALHLTPAGGAGLFDAFGVTPQPHPDRAPAPDRAASAPRDP